jgi:IS605 OrfB family transposase
LISECRIRGVKEIAIGDLNGIRENMDYSDSVNQRLHHWPYRKIINMIKYKGGLAGIEVRDNIDERKYFENLSWLWSNPCFQSKT